jgi:GxxExxY protein
MDTGTAKAHESEHNGPVEASSGDGATSGRLPELLHRELTGEIIAAFFTVFGELGYGFVEHVYVRALAIELFVRRVNVSREVPVTVLYKGVTVGNYRADLIVDEKVVVEVKAGERPSDADRFQLLNYLRCSGKEVGLLLHFGPKPTARRVIATRNAVAIEKAETVPEDSAIQ